MIVVQWILRVIWGDDLQFTHLFLKCLIHQEYYPGWQMELVAVLMLSSCTDWITACWASADSVLLCCKVHNMCSENDDLAPCLDICNLGVFAFILLFPAPYLGVFALFVNYFLAQKGFYLLENNTIQINLELRTPQVRDQVIRGWVVVSKAISVTYKAS